MEKLILISAFLGMGMFFTGCEDAENGEVISAQSATQYNKGDDDSSSRSDDSDSKSDDDDGDGEVPPTPEPLNENELVVTAVAAVKPANFFRRRSYVSISAKDLLLVVRQTDFCATIALEALRSNQPMTFKTTADPRIKDGFNQEIYDFRTKTRKSFWSCSL